MKYKSVWISDLHLGSKYSNIDKLIEFIKNNEFDNLFMVGDIIDGLELKRRWYWNESYNLFIQKLLRKSRKGTKITYLIGNHDWFLKNIGGNHFLFGDIEICDEKIHTTVDGKKCLIIHGDKFDGILNSMTWISHLGSWLYDVILFLNDKINKFRTKKKIKEWSLAQMIKSNVKEAIRYIVNYESALIEETKMKDCSAVIVGHSHVAGHKFIDGIEYLNSGSWMEGVYYVIVEHETGKLELISL